MTAIAYDYTAVAEYLISELTEENRPVQFNHRDFTGNTPLYLCSISDNVRIASLLLANGAKPTARNNAGENPIAIIETTREKSTSEIYQTSYAAYDPDDVEYFPVVDGPSTRID